MDKGCSVDECDAPHHAHGYCRNHYRRFKLYGDPLGGPGRGTWARKEPAQRFWEKVDKTGDCWIWTAQTLPAGYAQFWFEGRKVLSHRFAWELANGPIPDELTIDHLCGNPSCVRVAHMELVTLTENIRRASSAKYADTCKHGHPWTAESTYIHPRRGTRSCTICQRTRERAYSASKRSRA